MSKLYDDLKHRDGREENDNLDLFAYAASKKPPPEPSPESPAPAQPEPEIREPEPVVAAPPEEPEPEPMKPASPLYRGLSPLAGVRPPPHADDRRAVIIAVVAVCGLLIMAFLIVGIVRGLSQSTPVQVASVPAAAEEPVTPAPVRQSVRAAPAPAVKPVVKPAEKPTAKQSVELGGKGMPVTAEGNEKVVIFETGLFSAGTRMSREGENMLGKIGRQLAPHAKTVAITVIGCTDNLPVSGKKGYKDNKALGLMRAAEAARVLQSSSGLPVGAFKTVSHGAEWSPFPNDTASSRARNRTVVLRISFR